MKILPNGVTVFNATLHTIRFWDTSWPEPVEAEPDELVNARPVEVLVEPPPDLGTLAQKTCEFVRTKFVGTDKGQATITAAYANGADVVVGSIIAAQAYPGLVLAMVSAEGFERVPPAEKRMRPDKFTVFAEIADA